jgi:hypothetical protein
MPAQAADRLNDLMGRMREGWTLMAPVIERADYHGSSSPTSAFEFVLRHELGCQVIAVPDCPQLRQFLDERGLDVVAL